MSLTTIRSIIQDKISLKSSGLETAMQLGTVVMTAIRQAEGLMT